MKRKFLALFLTAALALSVTACGNDSASTSAPADTKTEADAGQETKDTAKEETKDAAKEETKDASAEAPAEVEDPIAESLKRMNDVTSMEMEMVMNMDMSFEADGDKQAVESVTVMDMECITDPLKIKMEMDMDMGAAGSMSMSIYGDIDENGNYMMYMFDGASWSAMPVAEIDMEAYNAQSSMAAQIGDTSVYTLEGTEKLNGADAYKYSYTMTGDEMKAAIRDAGALDSLTSLGISQSDAYNMLDGLGEVVTYVWVDAETFYPIQYEMDMTDVMDALMVGVIEAMGEEAEGISMHVSKMEMTMTCSNFNGISDITVPKEALAAAAAQ